MSTPRFALACFWTVIIFGLCWTPRSLLPVEEKPEVVDWLTHLDKVVHFALFAGFGFFWMLSGIAKTRWVLVAGVAAAAISELGQQSSLVNREAEWSDGLADVLGLVVGIGFLVILRGLFRRRSPKAPSAGTP